MASPRGTRRKTASKPDTVDLSDPSQPGTPSNKASGRIGHARSYSSPARAAASSPAVRGKGSDDDDFDFAFDKMSSGDDDDSDEFVPASAKKRKTKKAAAAAKKSSPAPKGTPKAKKTGNAKATGTTPKKASPAAKAKATASSKNTAPSKKTAGGGTSKAGPARRIKTSPASAKKKVAGAASSAASPGASDTDDSAFEEAGGGSPPASDESVTRAAAARPARASRSSATAKRAADSVVHDVMDVDDDGGEDDDLDLGEDSDGGPSKKAARKKLTKKDASNGGNTSLLAGAGPGKAKANGKGKGKSTTKRKKGQVEESDSDEDFLLDSNGKTEPRSSSEDPVVLEVGDKGSDLDLSEGSPSSPVSPPPEQNSKPRGGGGKSAAASKAKASSTDGATAASGRKKGKGKSAAAASMSTSKPYKLAADVEVVLKRLRTLRKEMGRGGGGGVGGGRGGGSGSGKKAPSLQELGLGGDVTEVREMGAAGVMDEIERIAVQTALSIMEGQGFSFRVPTRSSGNQKYVEELDRIVLGDKVSHRNFVSTSMARKTAITTRVVQLVHQVLGKGIHITKRDMFYTDVKLFKDQADSDNVLDDVACMVGCTRSCLNVVASDKGLVVGRVTFLEDGDMIDCTRMGVGGKAIPPYIDKITDIKSDAEFILLVEKEAAYMRMAEDRFYQKYPCIVITAKGQPDVATRLFLKRLKRELNIPVMGLVDSDPYGLKILSVYMSGSKNMSYDSASLTTPDIKWLGVRPSDLDRYSIPEQCRLDMTEHDIKTGKELLQEDFIKKNKPWCLELELMIKSKKKAEIQSLSAFGFQYLTHTYLPQKLQNGDWV